MGMLAGLNVIVLGEIDLAQRDVRIGKRGLEFEGAQQVALGVVAAMLDAEKLREMVVALRPVGVLAERLFLLGDLARRLVVERGIGGAAEEIH